MAKVKPFTVVTTFAGCGGSSLGYKQAGGRVLLAVEWDKGAAEIYRRNMGLLIWKMTIRDIIAL